MERERTTARRRQRRATDEKGSDAPLRSLPLPPQSSAAASNRPASKKRLLATARPSNSVEHLENVDDATSALSAGLEEPPSWRKKQGTKNNDRPSIVGRLSFSP